MSSLKVRNRQPELMDDPALATDLHHQALRGLRRVNAFSGSAGSIWKPIRELAARQQRPIRILDVACGGGDTAIGLWKKAQRAGIDVVVDGCDFSDAAIDYAAGEAEKQRAQIRFFKTDVIASPLPGGYDVICCSLFLHHLDDDDVILLLKSFAQSAAQMIVISDLLRSRIGYGLCWAGIRLLTRSRICHVDGPLSVQGAYTIDELKNLASVAGLDSMQFQRRWPERCLMTWRKGDDYS